MRFRRFRTWSLAALVLGMAAGLSESGVAQDAKTDLVPLSKFFKGKVIRVEGREIELHYDFEEAAQLLDFAESLPFRLIKNIKFEFEQGRVRVKGTGSMQHKAVFREKVHLSADFQPFKNRDFGMVVTEERESEVFTLYGVYDKYFSATDGVTTHQNMIIKFIPRDPKINKDGMQDWRYCGSRGGSPQIKRGTTYRVTVERGDNQSLMLIDDDFKSKGKEAGRDLTSQMAAIYGVKADIRVDNLVLIGQLDPDYIEANKLDMTEIKPPKRPDAEQTEPVPVIEDEETTRIRALIAGYPAKTKPVAMARLLRDTKVPVALRQEAVTKLVENGKKQIVPYLLDGLSSADEDTRRLSFEVFEPLVGKSFGYRPDAKDGARSSSMKRINKHIETNAAEFQ